MAERDSLAGLLAHMRLQAHERGTALQDLGQAAGEYPDLPALEDFRRLWSRQRTREQLRATRQPPPAGAGPLNSASLAHRALALMRTDSPGYLQHFMAYLDALSWLEAMRAEGALADPDAPSPAPARKRAGRRKPRG